MKLCHYFSWFTFIAQTLVTAWKPFPYFLLVSFTTPYCLIQTQLLTYFWFPITPCSRWFPFCCCYWFILFFISINFDITITSYFTITLARTFSLATPSSFYSTWYFSSNFSSAVASACVCLSSFNYSFFVAFLVTLAITFILTCLSSLFVLVLVFVLFSPPWGGQVVEGYQGYCGGESM